MGIRGRPSSASLQIVSRGVASDVQLFERPSAPDELTAEQAAEWDDIVMRMPPDWFPRETHGMLAQYCRHTVSARRVAALVASMEAAGGDFDVEQYDRLLKMQEREGRALSSLATRMRISQQSSFDKSKKRGMEAAKTPWADGGDRGEDE